MSTIGSLGSYAAQLWSTQRAAQSNTPFNLPADQQAGTDSPRAATAVGDYAAVATTAGYDEAFAKLKLALANQGSDSNNELSESQAGKKTASEEFHEWMNMTPGEKLRASILKELGISEEELANMSPEARKNIEDGIAQKVQELFAKQAQEAQKDYRTDSGDATESLLSVTA